MITTIEDAIKNCSNNIVLRGKLQELNVDFNDRGDDVVVKYKGAITLWGTQGVWINFYGVISNNSPMFESITKELKALTACIKTISNNGEIDDVHYYFDACPIYMYGHIISPYSIKAEYIAQGSMENIDECSTCDLSGIVADIDIDRHEVTLLIADSYYHQYVTLPYIGDATETNEVRKFNVIVQPIISGYPPISCRPTQTHEAINKETIEQIKLEHEIYSNSINQ